ncbi:MAG: DUF2520 domain-containing protein [Bacteroidales bacterium]|nr:DUF2520 domain-containing protein [Bacteroidales bacterium]
MKTERKQISVLLVGSGRVATHIAKRLVLNNVCIPLVVSRSLENAQKLADKIGAEASITIPEVTKSFDFVLISVNDDAYENRIFQLKNNQDSIILHTSGSLGMDFFPQTIANYGVLYPFQTFSMEREVDFSTMPVMIEANTSANLEKIRELAVALSPEVVEVNSDQRAKIHIAAVLVCNFVNHLYVEAETLLKQNDIDFSILHSLMRETTQKAIEISPAKAQTGPAVRNDQKIINKHMSLITDDKLRDLYQKFSNLIIEKKSKND